MVTTIYGAYNSFAGDGFPEVFVTSVRGKIIPSLFTAPRHARPDLFKKASGFTFVSYPSLALYSHLRNVIWASGRKRFCQNKTDEIIYINAKPLSRSLKSETIFTWAVTKRGPLRGISGGNSLLRGFLILLRINVVIFFSFSFSFSRLRAFWNGKTNIEASSTVVLHTTDLTFDVLW